MENMWVLIPIAFIIMGGWSEWLKFKEKQIKLGASAESLESEFEKMSARLEKQNATLIERVKNLEAIVTSPDWDQLTDSPALQAAAPRLEIESQEPTDADEATRIARKIR
jgi:hypothetical protein